MNLEKWVIDFNLEAYNAKILRGRKSKYTAY